MGQSTPKAVKTHRVEALLGSSLSGASGSWGVGLGDLITQPGFLFPLSFLVPTSAPTPCLSDGLRSRGTVSPAPPSLRWLCQGFYHSNKKWMKPEDW